MKIKQWIATISCGLAMLSAGQVLAEGHQNSSIRVAINSEGVAYVHKDDSFGAWRIKPLPYGQKAVAASGSYFHYRPGSPIAPGYAYDEEAAFVIGEYGNAFQYKQYNWRAVNGCWGAKDITSNTLEHAYCVNGDGTLKKFDTGSQTFAGYYPLPGHSIKKIDVNQDGVVYAVTEDSQLFKYALGQWTAVNINCVGNCVLNDVAVGGGDIYLTVSNDQVQGAYMLEQGQLHRLGDYKSIEVDRDNIIWAITNSTKKLMLKRPGMKEFIPDYRISHVEMAHIGS